MPRVFYALWPDDVQRDELYRAARAVQPQSGGRVMRKENLHQTLVFIGDIAETQRASIEAIGDSIKAEAFDLAFGALRYWRHNRIVWAAPLEVPEPLGRLVSALETGLSAASVKFDRRPYTPHVTLVRDARSCGELPELNFEWAVRDFALLESSHDGRHVVYRPLARWPLQVRAQSA